MQILTTLPGSGKLGGIVSTQTRLGSRLLSHPLRKTPSSQAQRQACNNFAAIASGWRALTSAQQAAWNAAAPGKQTGISLWMRRTYRAMLAGNAAGLLYPAENETESQIMSATLTPTYATSDETQYLSALALTWSGDFTTDAAMIIAASGIISSAIDQLPRTRLKIIASAAATASQPLDVMEAWTAVYGSSGTSGNLLILLEAVSPTSGKSSPPIAIYTAVTQYNNGGKASVSVTVEVEGATVAVVSDAAVSVEGVIVAE